MKAQLNLAQAISVSATANKFLSPDNLLNFNAVEAFQAKVKKVLEPEERCIYIVISRKAKPVAYSKSLDSKGDLRYRTKRAVKVAQRTRYNPESTVRVLAQFPVKPTEATQKLVAEWKMLEKAVAAHLKNIDRVKTGVTKEKAKIRAASEKEFNAGLKVLRDFLTEAGLDVEKNMVESQGMMGGKSILLKLNNDAVFSIGKSDISKFRAAVKNAQA